jgi:phosphatidylserine decarboxylase
MIHIMKFLPKNLISFIAGKLMHLSPPQPLRKWNILLFANIFGIAIEESEKAVSEYSSFGDFFTRKLKPGLRPVAETPYVHPADSELTMRGRVLGDQLLQAKGMPYKLSDFLQISSVEPWQKGFFLTYYLCPRDYHRVHSPVRGKIKEVRYVPGELWPVNAQSVFAVKDLFIRNERVVVDIETENGLICLVFVGATNVGSILLSFESSLRTNNTHVRSPKKITYLNPITVEKGDELGMFAMGSTVIIVAQSQWNILEKIVATDKSVFVKVGSNIQLNN